MTDAAAAQLLGPELAPLAALARARASVAEYYEPLLDAEDEVVQVAACVALLEQKALRWQDFERAVALSRFGAVKLSAFQFFEERWEHDFAARSVAVPSDPETVAENALMAARLRSDDEACAGAWRNLYLALGSGDAPVHEHEHLYKAGGAPRALPIAVRNVLMSPHDPGHAYRLLQDCADMARSDLIERIASAFAAVDLHPRLAAVFSASGSLIDRQPEAAKQKLAKAASARPAPAAIATQIATVAQRLNADILDALGHYAAAYSAYQDINKIQRPNLPDLTSLKRRMTTVAAMQIPSQPQARQAWVTMTGFPRSGTTLLENALARHPAIETFEELPTRAAMQLYLDRELPRSPESKRSAIFREARERYYGEMERRRKKSSASVFIDKSPLRSADAGFMAKAFPGQRYIFSIRHPYDVVLSCFKLAFAPGMSMEVFRRFEDAVAFYDFAMSQWFGAYRMDDPNIHYLRYDDLVTDFESRMRGVLAFLDLDWHPDVLDFARAAENRASATPSYQKVRQGLSLGVQSSWRKYGFLFQSELARPLRRWVAHFGYSTE